MTLQLDIRAPLLVLVAEFNPAIFTLPWIGKHILGKAEGDDIVVTEVVAQTNTGLVQLSFLDGVAVNVGNGRTELFALAYDQATLAQIADFLQRMISALPHTPLNAIGCNLSYNDSAPSDAIVEMFNTSEGLEGDGALNLRQVGVQMQMEPPEVLNFSRSLSDQGVRFSFNYHYPEGESDAYLRLIPGWLDRCVEHSSAMLTRLYGYQQHETIAFGDAPNQNFEEEPRGD